jgi:hypothetical protein
VARADVKQLQAIPNLAAAGLDPGALRTEQLNNQDTGLILEEVETGQLPELKYIVDRSLNYKITGHNVNPTLCGMAY